MNDFDQGARYIAEIEPTALVARLLAGTGLTLAFSRWFPTHTIPRLQSPERTADLVAVLDDPAAPESPWLLVIEIQSRSDPGKIKVLLEEAAILFSRATWGDGRDYRVLPAMIHLTGRADPAETDLRTPSGHGLLHRPIAWDLSADDAANVLERVADGTAAWAMLFWLPLLNRGGEEIIVQRWREVVQAVVPDQKRRGNLRACVRLFAELARNFSAWERGTEGSEMGESQVANGWRAEGEARATLRTKRQYILGLLDTRFPGQAPTEVRQLIDQQDSNDVLDDWFQSLGRAATFDDFLQALRR